MRQRQKGEMNREQKKKNREENTTWIWGSRYSGIWLCIVYSEGGNNTFLWRVCNHLQDDIILSQKTTNPIFTVVKTLQSHNLNIYLLLWTLCVLLLRHCMTRNL
jgi:hypothetical protein